MRRWVILALVLCLHLLLLLGLQWGLRQANDKPLALPAGIDFYLPPLRRERPPTKEAKDARKRPADISRPSAATITSAPATEPSIPAAVTATVTAAPTAQSADPPPARLILTLPALAASAPRNPALSDARTNTARLTLEEKMARALDGTVHQQVMADGTTIRRRVGNQCVDLHESRAVALMPEVDFLRYAPRAIGPFYDCK